MSLHNTAPYFLTFYHSDQSYYSLFTFRIFILNTRLFTFFTTLCSWYDYAWLQYGTTIISMAEHSVTSANYCKVLI